MHTSKQNSIILLTYKIFKQYLHYLKILYIVLKPSTTILLFQSYSPEYAQETGKTKNNGCNISTYSTYQ